MKKLFLLMLACGFLFAPSAWAYTIDNGSIDVGDLDTILAKTALKNSGEDTEEAWVSTILGGTWSIEWKTEDPLSTLVDGGTNIYASRLNDAPTYYLLKLGNVQPGNDAPSTVDDTFLYTNFASLNYAVFDVSEWGSEANIGKLSHISEGPGTSVPEPGTLLLLGFGLVGLAGVGVRKFRK